jgi:hypothetical protein
VKGDKRAAAARLLAVTNRYPLYSKSDRALWMMGDILENSEHKEVAALYYGRIVKNYPLSAMAPEAKDKLKAFGAPVPQPDPTAVAWMTAEQNAPRPHTSLVKKPMALISNGPRGELFTAARNGAPNLQPESDSMSAADILTPGGKSKLGAGTGLVATITPGVSGAAETTTASENVAATSDSAASAPATTEPPKDAGTAPTPTPSGTDATKNPPAAEGATEAPANPDATAAGADAKTDGRAAGTDATGAAKTGDSQNSSDPKKESSSKKKKGMRKLIPW